VNVAGVELLLARHGQTPDNAGGMILGRRDPSLSREGREQAARLAREAAREGVISIWTSPLMRARQTAAAVAEATGVEPVVLADLIESDRGSWEGQSLARLAEHSPQLHAAFEAADRDFAFPGGESLSDQVRRTRRALSTVAAGLAPALVVAHVGTIRAAMLALARRPPPERTIAHGEIVRLRWGNGGDR
jgi:ribonuclease H / adenosylcobalamin/alpha-ribazole phosphatase